MNLGAEMNLDLVVMAQSPAVCKQDRFVHACIGYYMLNYPSMVLVSLGKVYGHF